MTARSVGPAIVSGVLCLAFGPVGAGLPEAGWLGVTFCRGDLELRTEIAAVVESVHAHLGDQVRAGDLLVQLVAPELDARVERERAAHVASEARAIRAEVELAEADRAVARRSTAPDIFSVAQVEAAQSARARAAANLAAARAQVAEQWAILADLERTSAALEVRAPADGVVASSWWEPGERVPAGSTVVRLTGHGEIRVRFAAPAEAALVPGVRVTVNRGEATWTAVVRNVAPELDPRIGLLFVEAVLVPGEAPSRPGEPVRVRRAAPGPSDDP